MKLTTINILGKDFTVYGLTEKEYKEHEETLPHTTGTTFNVLGEMYIMRRDFTDGDLNMEAVETTMAHEIGHAIEDNHSLANVRPEEEYPHYAELVWKYCKLYIPKLKRAWLKHTTLKENQNGL